MALMDLVNMVFRNYTVVNDTYPAPGGDPSTPRYVPKMGEIRAVFGAAQDSLAAAVEAVEGSIPAIEAARDDALEDVQVELANAVGAIEASEDSAVNAITPLVGQATSARDAAVAAAASLNLPPIQPGDAGKILQVRQDEIGYEHAPNEGGGGGAPVTPQGRLTLAAGVSVTSSDIVGATTVYYTPCIGSRVPLWNGSAFVNTMFLETALALSADAGHAGYHQAGKNFDVFIFNESGALRIGTGPAWSTETFRGVGAGTTEVLQMEGIWVNAAAITLRSGAGPSDTVAVEAGHATLVGTIRTSDDGLVEDSLKKRFIANAYNLTLRPMAVPGGLGTYQYSSPTLRQVNADPTQQFEYIHCFGGIEVEAEVNIMGLSSGSTGRYIATHIGVDSTTVNSAQCRVLDRATNAHYCHSMARYKGCPGIGYHRITWLENSEGTDTQSFVMGTARLVGSGLC